MDGVLISFHRTRYRLSGWIAESALVSLPSAFLGRGVQRLLEGRASANRCVHKPASAPAFAFDWRGWGGQSRLGTAERTQSASEVVSPAWAIQVERRTDVRTDSWFHQWSPEIHNRWASTMLQLIDRSRLAMRAGQMGCKDVFGHLCAAKRAGCILLMRAKRSFSM